MRKLVRTFPLVPNASDTMHTNPVGLAQWKVNSCGTFISMAWAILMVNSVLGLEASRVILQSIHIIMRQVGTASVFVAGHMIGS